MKSGLWAALGSILVLGACAAPQVSKEDVARIRNEVKTVAFVQDGKVPHEYKIGAVDTATGWGGGDLPTVQAGNGTGVTHEQAFVAAVIMDIGAKAAKDKLKEDPGYYRRLLAKMVGDREFTSQVAPMVFPLMADAWGVPYDASKVIVHTGEKSAVDSATKSFVGKDPGTDLVLVYGMPYMALSEVAKMKDVFKAVVTAGTHDRDVTSHLAGKMTAFKRGPDGKLAQVWQASCLEHLFISADVTEKFVVLKDHPEKAKPVFDAALPLAMEGCKLTLKRGMPR